jgi:hypothetical protein
MMSYHPLYDGLWTDERLGSFECRAFFAFLFSHPRVRPSGIYRVTDRQLAVDTGLPLRRVRAHLARLESTKRIIRDASFLFVVGYLKRQPRFDRLILSVQRDLSECTSARVLEAFSQKYPHLDKWSRDRLEAISPSVDTLDAVSHLARQLRAEQLNSEQSNSSAQARQEPGPASAPSSAPAPAPASQENPDSQPEELKTAIAEFMRTVRAGARLPEDTIPPPRRARGFRGTDPDPPARNGHGHHPDEVAI